MTQRNHVYPKKGNDTDLENGSWKHVKAGIKDTVDKKHEGGTLKMKLSAQEKREKQLKFEDFYKKLGSKLKPEEKRIDYVLVHPVVKAEDLDDEEDRAELERKNSLRDRFEIAIKQEGLQKQKVEIDDKIYSKLHCPFRRLCEEAELVSLEMPLAGCESENKEEPGKFNDWVNRTFVTDNEVDMVSAPFKMDRMDIYQDNDDPTHFFRPSVRGLLIEHILINIDLRNDGSKDGFKHANKSGPGLGTLLLSPKTVHNCWGCMKDDTEELGDMQKVGLDYMKIEGVYESRFVLHEESNYDPDNKDKYKDEPLDPDLNRNDPRLDMQLTWTKFFKFQPLWKIRNYYGEKIAFYFAWSGALVSTLWLPMLFGFAIFLYGLVESIKESVNGEVATSNSTLSDLFVNIKQSFDNDVTPFFALFLCVWGTLFMEYWKRTQSELAYQWDVEQFEENEPDRPEFYGTKTKIDPITKEKDWYYPFTRRMWKIFLSAMTLLFMVLLVTVSVLSVIVYRVIANVDYCPKLSDGACLFVTTIISSLFNAISILILGKIYDKLAYILTDWENHRTETAYNDALIIKLFGFQFVNNYSSCFYIAFFRGRFDDDGLLGRGAEYQDNCEGTCMSQLSFQVLILMLTKPIPKFLMDVVLPWAMKQFKKRCQCCACIPCLKNILRPQTKPDSEKTLLELELEKPSLGNFTLSEYTEKVIVYGLMMLFAASFPLAPFIALFVNMIDLRIDAWRLLWVYQRPMAIISEDIGTWFVILTFINYTAVVSNAFLIAFTANWGSYFSTVGKLWVVIGFEHIVFCLKFILAYMIPDTPAGVKLAMRKKQYHLNRVLQERDYDESKGKPELGPLILERSNTPGDKPWTSEKKFRRYDDNETEVRKMKKKSVLKKDDEDIVVVTDKKWPPQTDDHSRRAPARQISEDHYEEMGEFPHHY